MVALEASRAPQGSSAFFVVVLLAIAALLGGIDRFVLAILVQPIKHDLALSDVQVGLLIGFAFTICNAIAAVPLARYADRGWRRMVLTGSIVGWSVATALCGAAQSFAQIFGARILVGTGEAGLSPSTYSFISENYPPERRSLPIGMFIAGIGSGIVVGFAVGGQLAQLVGWRLTFVAVALPGLVLAPIVGYALRGQQAVRMGRNGTLGAPTSLLFVWKELLRNGKFRQLVLAFVLNGFVLYGQSQWSPAFYQRRFFLNPADAGWLLALTTGMGTLIGMIGGGFIADYFARANPRWPLRQVVFGLAVGQPIALAAFCVPTLALSLACAFVGTLIRSLANAPLTAEVTTTVPRGAIASAMAIVILAQSLIGTGAGPFYIGAISDLLHASLGSADALRWGLIATAPFALWGLVHVVLSARATHSAPA